MIRTKVVSEAWNLPVYTDAGEYFGEIVDAIIVENKVFGWKVSAAQDSSISKFLKGAKGVIVPHPLIRAMGDIVIISKAAVPSVGERTAIEYEQSAE